MSSAWYNILVVGTDLGALVYAALAAKAGYRVGVVAHGHRSNSYRHEGQVFLREPERFFGFSTSPVVAKVLGELSMTLEMKNRPQQVDPTLQLVTPEMRLDIGGSARRWERELLREAPDARDAVLGFEDWAAEQARLSEPLLMSDLPLPPRGLRGAARYRMAVHKVPSLAADHSGRTPRPVSAMRSAMSVLEAPLSHLASVWSHPCGAFALSRLWTHLRAGMYRLPDGLDGLKQLFIRKIRDQCGDYRQGEAVEEIIFRRGKVREVLLASRRETLGCELLVVGSSPAAIFDLIPQRLRMLEFHDELADNLRPQAWRMTINVAVDPAVIPRGMGPEVLLADPRQPLVGENCLWISRPGVGPYSGSESRPGRGVLMVTALLPSRGIAPTAGGVQTLVTRSMARLRELIPWLDDHLLSVHVPCLTESRQTRQPMVDMSELTPTMLAPHPMMLGVGAVPVETAYKNILVSGDLPLAGLGFEGAFLGAWQALYHTRRMLKLHRTLG